MKLFLLTCCLLLPIAGFASNGANEGRVIHCATVSEVRAALKELEPGDTVMLEGGKTYEIDRSFKLKADGREGSNVIEDLHIHHTHNAAVAVRDESHHNSFRRMNIHHIGEWLHKDYNAHEGEGFYLGSSKSFSEEGYKARIHDILIEDSIIGPGLLGQYVDIKYGASAVTVRNNVLHCGEKSYNEEVVKLAGFANLIENNRFVGSNETMTRYIHVHKKKTKDPVRVDYLGQENIPAPSGRDNSILNNIFYTDDPAVVAVKVDLPEADRSSIQAENNRILPLAHWKGQP